MQTSSPSPLRISKAEYITSAVGLDHCPPPDRPDVAIAGRSNVGKSSLINLICNRRNLAKTSNTPGKTRAINFFDCQFSPTSFQFYLVDLPGYGYAKVSKQEKAQWDRFLSEYLQKRTSLVGLIHLIDSRHPPSVHDEAMREWMLHSKLPVITVLTKADKLGKIALQKQTALIRKALGIRSDEAFIITSTLKKMGIEETLAALAALLDSAPVRRVQ